MAKSSTAKDSGKPRALGLAAVAERLAAVNPGVAKAIQLAAERRSSKKQG